MGKRRQRERREPKKEPAGSGRRIGWYVLAACAAVLAVALPGPLLRLHGDRWVGQVQEADTAYYSRQLEAYTGELDLYRKLLLLSGRWEAERTLVDQGNPWPEWSEETVETDAAGAPIQQEEFLYSDVWWEEWGPRRNVIGSVEERLRMVLYEYGIEMMVDQQDSLLEVYRLEDSRFRKYEFSYYVYQCFVTLVPEGTGTVGEGIVEEICLLLDAETGMILELDWGPQGAGLLREMMPDRMSDGGLLLALMSVNEGGYQNDAVMNQPDTAYWIPLHPEESLAVQNRWVSPQAENPGEYYAWVYQVDADGARFYAGLPWTG